MVLPSPGTTTTEWGIDFRVHMFLGAVFRKKWAVPVLLIVAVFSAYLPVGKAGFIWDDDAHVTKPELQSVEGLARIWVEPGASQQYYPVVHSVFWLEHRVLGDDPLGYHVINVWLHALCAVLLFGVLRRLDVPGAWLAAVIFALHPVQVESVAWVAELKNTLSGVFYLSAAWFYLEYDEKRTLRTYVLALILFLLGLLSKSVIATLPAALLVVFWWKRGRLSMRRDVRPLTPFFLTGLGSGLFTCWIEHRFIGASGAEFGLLPLERGLIAGRAIWFYLWKLAWPLNLSFIYPRWQVSQTEWWQYVFPATVLVLLAVLAWRTRRGGARGPTAALFFFVGTLFPALGFVNVYPFRYAFVADHFQYLACIGPITLVAAGLVAVTDRWRKSGWLVCVALVSVLAVLTWRQSRMYEGMRTLWETTIRRNPECWMAYSNLSVLALEEGRVDEAIYDAKKALALNPRGYREAYVNLGNALFQKGEPAAAQEAYEKALKIEPSFALAWNNLGNVLLGTGRIAESIGAFENAIKLRPGFVEAHSNLGNALLQTGDAGQAIVQFKKALASMPDYGAARAGLGAALAQRGDADGAVVEFRRALEIDPHLVQARLGWADLLLAKGNARDAARHFSIALEDIPKDAKTHFNLGRALVRLGEVRQAMQQWERAYELAPAHPSAPNELAWLLSTLPDPAVRDGPRALSLGEMAVKLSAGADPAMLDTLAAAEAECGQFEEASATARRASDLALAQGKTALVEEIRSRLELYARHAPFRTGAGNP